MSEDIIVYAIKEIEDRISELEKHEETVFTTLAKNVIQITKNKNKISELEKVILADTVRVAWSVQIANEIVELREKINNVRVVRDDGLMFAAESLDKLQNQLNELKDVGSARQTEVGFDGFLGSNETRKEYLNRDSGGEKLREWDIPDSKPPEPYLYETADWVKKGLKKPLPESYPEPREKINLPYTSREKILISEFVEELSDPYMNRLDLIKRYKEKLK